MFSKYDQWNTQQSRMDAYQKAQQKSLRISQATTGKKKQRKPENKGKHRQTASDKKIVVNKKGISATSVRTANKGNVDVDINIIKTPNRPGQGRPPASTGTGRGRRGNTLKEAFEFRNKSDDLTFRERERRDRNERQRQERQDRIDRENREARERARERARQATLDEQNRRRENTRLMIERERLELERARANAPPPPAVPVAPAPAHHPDDIGRGFAEINARIGALDANVRAGQAIAPPPVNVEVNPRIEVNPNIRVVGVEQGGIVINNENAQRQARQRGRRANMGRRGGGHSSSESHSSSSEGFSSPTEEAQAIARRSPARRRGGGGRGGGRQPPPARTARRTPTITTPYQPPREPEPERQPESETSESEVLVEALSGAESDDPSLAQQGAEALLGLGATAGGAVARGVGAGVQTIGERAVEQLPTAEDVGGAVGGAIATGAGIAGRGALALGQEVGQRAVAQLPTAEEALGVARNLLRDAITPAGPPEIEQPPRAELEESGVLVEPQQPVGTIAQRIAERQERQRRELEEQQAEEARRRRKREEERRQRLEIAEQKAQQGEQGGILADIAQRAGGAVGGAVVGGARAVGGAVAEGARQLAQRPEIQTGVNVLRDAVIGTAPRQPETPAPLGLGEEPVVSRRDSIRSGVSLYSDYFGGTDTEREREGSGTESDTSFAGFAGGGSAFGSSGEEGLLDTRRTGKTPRGKPEGTLFKKDLEEPFTALEQYVKTGGDIAKESDTPPSSPESVRVATKPKPEPQPEPAPRQRETARTAIGGVPRFGESETEGETETETETEEKFRDLTKLSPKELLRTGQRLQRQQIKVDSLLTQALREPEKLVVGQKRDSPSDTESSGAESVEIQPSPTDFFGQSGDLEVSGFGAGGTTTESESEGETIAERRRRERATIRREQLRRGVSAREADTLAKIGTAYLGESSGESGAESDTDVRQQRLMENQQLIATLEKSLEQLTLQRARKKGMGQEAKTQYDRNITEHQRVISRLRGQNSFITEGKPYGERPINFDSPLIQTANRINAGEELVATKGGARAGAGRRPVVVSDNPQLQERFERTLRDKTANLGLLNQRLNQFGTTYVDAQITTRGRPSLERYLTGRATTEQIAEILRIYDNILENKRLERLYRKGDRG